MDFPNTCISEDLYMSMATELVNLGLSDLGYRYVNIDDCWSELYRGDSGELIENKQRFPHGISWLSDRIHELGLFFGMYTDIGTMTCGGYPGLDSHIDGDVAQFVIDWKIDSLKVDGCYANVKEMSAAYTNLGRALNSTGRPVLYSCSWPAYQADHCENDVDMATLIRECNLWRNFDDIYDEWASVRSIANFWARNSTLFRSAAGPGHWNDPDMLLVGNPGLSISEQRAQMALWAILAAPLYISADLRTISPESLAILKNRDVIAINQDILGVQGFVVSEEGGYRIWAKPLSDPTTVAVLFENKNSIFGKIRFQFNPHINGLTMKCARDVHLHAEIAVGETFTVDVDESGVEMFVFSTNACRSTVETDTATIETE